VFEDTNEIPNPSSTLSPMIIECVEIVQRSAYIFHPNDDKNMDSLGLGV